MQRIPRLQPICFGELGVGRGWLSQGISKLGEQSVIGGGVHDSCSRDVLQGIAGEPEISRCQSEPGQGKPVFEIGWVEPRDCQTPKEGVRQSLGGMDVCRDAIRRGILRGDLQEADGEEAGGLVIARRECRPARSQVGVSPLGTVEGRAFPESAGSGEEEANARDHPISELSAGDGGGFHGCKMRKECSG